MKKLWKKRQPPALKICKISRDLYNFNLLVLEKQKQNKTKKTNKVYYKVPKKTNPKKYR